MAVLAINKVFPVHTNLEVPQFRAVITLDIKEEEENHGPVIYFKLI
jgi:hypothetical protein